MGGSWERGRCGCWTKVQATQTAAKVSGSAMSVQEGSFLGYLERPQKTPGMGADSRLVRTLSHRQSSRLPADTGHQGHGDQ